MINVLYVASLHFCQLLRFRYQYKTQQGYQKLFVHKLFCVRYVSFCVFFDLQSLSSKQRTMKKNGNDLNEKDQGELDAVSTRAQEIQKTLEKIRKNSRTHAMLINDHKNKKQKAMGIDPSKIPDMPQGGMPNLPPGAHPSGPQQQQMMMQQQQQQQQMMGPGGPQGGPQMGMQRMPMRPGMPGPPPGMQMGPQGQQRMMVLQQQQQAQQQQQMGMRPQMGVPGPGQRMMVMQGHPQQRMVMMGGPQQQQQHRMQMMRMPQGTMMRMPQQPGQFVDPSQQQQQAQGMGPGGPGGPQQMSPAQGPGGPQGGVPSSSPHSMHSGQPSPQSYPVTSPSAVHGRPGMTSPMSMPVTSPSQGMSPMNPPSQSPQPSMSPQQFHPHGPGQQGHFSGSQSPANSISRSPRNVSDFFFLFCPRFFSLFQ